MRVFLSWSGAVSRELAAEFNEWLPSVLQAVKPYFSPDDIEKGARWANEISGMLETCSVGLIFLTRDNLTAPWIMFEAGALSKKLENSKVSPILFELDHTDINGPIQQFQATLFQRDDIKKLVSSLNSGLAERGLPAQIFDNTFDKWWPELEDKIAAILAHKPERPRKQLRSDRDLIEEILQISRRLEAEPKLPISYNEARWDELADLISSVNRLLMRLLRDDLSIYLPKYLFSIYRSIDNIQIDAYSEPLADQLSRMHDLIVRLREKSISQNSPAP